MTQLFNPNILLGQSKILFSILSTYREIDYFICFSSNIIIATEVYGYGKIMVFMKYI